MPQTKTYREAAEEQGLRERTNDYLPWRKEGFHAVLKAIEQFTIPAHTAIIAGKKKKIAAAPGYKVEVYYCSDESLDLEKVYTLGVSGLLKWQLTESEDAPKDIPFKFGLRCKGKDKEDRWQTVVEFEK